MVIYLHIQIAFIKLLKRIHSDTFVNHNTINTGYIHWCSHVAYIHNLLNLTNTIFNVPFFTFHITDLKIV